MLVGRRGQVPETISSFAVLVITFFIMGLFVTGSFAIAGVKDVSFDANVLSKSYSFLLEEIVINGDEYSVFDAYVFYENDVFDRFQFEDEILKLVEKGNCLVLAKGESEEPYGKTGGFASDDFFIDYSEELNSLNRGARPLKSEYGPFLVKLEFLNKDGKRIYVEAYYGGCLNE
jgi:hypothetical protein